MNQTRWSHKLVLLFGAGALIAGCGSSGESSSESQPIDSAPAVDDTTAGSTPESPSEAGVDLASVCPNPIVIQTGWYPAVDRAFLYGLAEPGGNIDSAAGVYTAPTRVDPNVDVEIRAGGPLVGFQQGNALLYTDPDILIADQNLDAMLAASKNFPTTSIMSPYDKFPQILMWNPEEVEASTIEDIKQSGVTVVVAENAVYADSLVGAGLLDQSQIDKSFDGSPARFVASNGNFAQQGFATSDPYLYENQLEDWMKPVDYLYINDAGYPVYGTLATTRPELIVDEADCFERLVPAMQQTYADFLDDPQETLDLIGTLSTAYNDPAELSPEALNNAVSILREELIDRGNTLGDVDEARVQALIDMAGPILVENGADVDEAMTSSALATNQFIDTTIEYGN